ncbi:MULTISPECIES: hypothetical protein [Variovorax]|jgi:hypothetical protein|uniref:hypothetical protein n=1 Tax=Variovorax TaxID=34072 RepID=UPI00086E2DD2|nr:MULTISPECIES: hypothetical protein [Variovorax]MBN8755747.1 hypothetical protein [Variovorax sp.]ODU14719.1 MAG: hypothetical protein ABS94_20360 [Variovorax sp. SCN 67-85]ODV23865.1 MAG: hypothetical protein ABT25_16890 [Variovorax sp. SCN 67-20]OJZ03561.1 MAG: hypothetical protein BGP22_01765 [Variovorax sp. 67-131]UKI07255.1 hypothetical protein L3V85_31370 [Variovorax paradoxus]
MHIRSSLTGRRAALGLALAGAFTLAGAADFAGRGVFNFKSDAGCPFAALAGAGNDCNRLALDDPDTHAALDSAAHTIRFSNTRGYADKTIVGDVLLQGSGQARNGGRRVPLTFHALLSRSGNDWSVSSHAHTPVGDEFSDIRIDAYQVVVNDGGTDRVVLTPAQITEALARPSLTARLANVLVQVEDNRANGAKDADITIGLGLGKASKSVARARFHAPAAKGRELADAMQQGNWTLELQALSGKIPRQVVQRDMFLYGLESQSLLQPLLQRGFHKNEKLVLGAANGKGYVRYDGQQREFAGADAAARAFLQDSFIGLVLGWQQQQPQQQPVQAKADGR